MDRIPGRLGAAGAPSAAVCCSCGGSGVLRTDAASYRTCLNCLGQGRLPAYEPPAFLPPAEVLRRRRWSDGVPSAVSAWSSGAR